MTQDKSSQAFEAGEILISTYNPEPNGGWSPKLDRGVRIVHLPTGLVAESHEDRSMFRNRAIAMDKLQQLVMAHGLGEAASIAKATGETE